MTFSRKIELAGGIATIVLALFASITEFVPRLNRDFIVGDLIGLAVYLALPFLVAMGAYFHAAQQKKFGFWLLLPAGLILTAMLLVHLLGGVFYLFGLWGGIAVLAPSVTAIVTLIAALFTLRTVRRTSGNH